MAIFRKGEEVKVANSPYLQASLKRQGFVEESKEQLEPKLVPLAENPEVKEPVPAEPAPKKAKVKKS